MRATWLFFFAVIMLLSLSSSSSGANPVAAAAALPAHHMSQDWQAFQRGDFSQAVASWEAAANAYERTGERGPQSDARIKLAHAYQALGHYRKALQNLESAFTLAQQAGDQARIAAVLSSLGQAYTDTGPTDEAEPYLRQGLRLARETHNTALVAATLNNLGNLLAAKQKYNDAMTAYKESTRLALIISNAPLATSAQINTAMVLIRNQQYEQSKAALDDVMGRMRSLEASHHKMYSLLNVGLASDELRPHLPAIQDALLRQTYQMFNEALHLAQMLGDARGSSYALGYMGKLYESEHRYQEALRLTRRAVWAAQQANAPESLYRWQWQIGRLFNALGQRDDAMAAYRRAVETLQPIRHEMATSPSVLPSFREAVGPVYFGLADLLLRHAASLRKQEQYAPYLEEARDIVERFKAAELQNYFQDECVEVARSRVTRLDAVSQTAVVVYPIILPDRLELLVSLPSGLERFTVPVDAKTLTQVVRHFEKMLVKRTTREFLPYAQQLYDWIIRPLDPVLTPLTLETLVFVPDGPLRTIPMAALHDGRDFLIRKYALAATPGLDLTDPRPLKRQKDKILAVGLTKSVQGFPSLPNVLEELQAIHDFYGGTVLLNEQFSTANVEADLRQAQFSIVHIASHGQFDGDLDKTYILTFDDKLTLDHLDRFVGFFRFRDDPLEMLTLSACQTAVGDDRAALGLAGIAIKAGARSALATLWFINDQSSSELVIEFYRQLQNPSISRAVALQRAQLKLLDDPRYEHPGYWSSFLLLNNWL